MTSSPCACWCRAARVNDVILSVCGGGLRKYLQHHGELPDRLTGCLGSDQWLAGEPRQATTIRAINVTSMTTLIYTDTKDPVKRLQKVMAATQKSKAAKTGVSARVMTDLSKHVPAATQVLASRLVLRTGATARMCNLFISNVPGPQLPLYMNGALQVGHFGMAPLVNGMGLFIATPSYNGNVSFNVTSTREIMPDIHFFVSCLRESLEELKTATLPVPKKRARKKSKTVRKRQKVNGGRPAAHGDPGH